MKEKLQNPNTDSASEVRVEVIKSLPANLGVQIAESYARVFAGPPWNEVTKCALCGQFFAEPGICEQCQSQRTVAYPIYETVQYLRGLLQKPNSIIALAKNPTGEVVGWSMGYRVDLRELLREKYPKEESSWKMYNLLNAVRVQGDVYYLAEAGIEPGWRGKGIIQQLYDPRIEITNSLNLQALVRTNVKSPINRVVQKYGFRQVLGPRANLLDLENPSREVIGALDPDNAQRVWYMRPNIYQPGVYGGRSDMPSDSI